MEEKNKSGSLFSAFKRRRLGNFGTPGVAVSMGMPVTGEKDPQLANHDSRYRLYSDIIVNTPIITSGIRLFLNLMAAPTWHFTAAEADGSGEFSELAEKSLMVDPMTSWPRIVKRASTYRHYGFSVMEWSMRHDENGNLTFDDIASRAQSTIRKWDVTDKGLVQGIYQTDPTDFREIRIPRYKVMYLVDDSLNSSPEGLGLLRSLVAPAKKKERYEELEGIGFETDMRGIPIARGPLSDLRSMVDSGEMKEEERKKLEEILVDFVKGHTKAADTGMVLDSKTYQTQDPSGRPSSVYQWSVELLQGSITSFQENAKAIERLNYELARVLGVEQLLLGSDSTGSYALSEDKTNSLFFQVDESLREICDGVRRDLLRPLWELNGWDMNMMPELSCSPSQYLGVETIAKILVDVAGAGLLRRDPAYQKLYNMLDLPFDPEIPDNQPMPVPPDNGGDNDDDDNGSL